MPSPALSQATLCSSPFGVPAIGDPKGGLTAFLLPPMERLAHLSQPIQRLCHQLGFAEMGSAIDETRDRCLRVKLTMGS